MMKRIAISLLLLVLPIIVYGQCDFEQLAKDAPPGSDLARAMADDPDIVDSWIVLYHAGRTGSGDGSNALTKNLEALRSLTKLRNNPKLKRLGITDSHLGNMLKGNGWGGKPDIPSYKQLCDEVDELINALPTNGVSNLTDFLGNKGLGIVGNAAFTRRHSYVQLKRLLDNKSFLSMADEVVFERVLRNTINGKTYESVSDVYIRLGNRVVEIETKAGMKFFTGSSSNFAKQSFNSIRNISSVEDYKIFLNRQLINGLSNTDKLNTINAWKVFEDGALLKDSYIQDLFTKYARKVLNDSNLPKFNDIELEAFLRSNDNWFYSIFDQIKG